MRLKISALSMETLNLKFLRSWLGTEEKPSFSLFDDPGILWDHCLHALAHYQSLMRMPALENIKDIIFILVVFKLVVAVLTFLSIHGILGSFNLLRNRVVVALITLMKKIPGAKGRIQQEIDKVVRDIESNLDKGTIKRMTELPQQGLSYDEVRALVKEYDSLNKADWKGGRVSGTVYHGGTDLSKLVCEVYARFCHSNPLHPDVFPSIRQMEAEVISMCLKIYNADPTKGCGTVTSGGTESILMACKAYRDRGFAEKRILNPEIVVPVTAHAAFDKAAHYFGLKIVHAPVDPISFRVSIKECRNLINSNTVMIVGSAPSYPHGVIDDIISLGKLATQKGIGLHVDCCLGSFIVPFLDAAGFSCPLFDFRVQGVTSISCDTHKFGFAPKGSSVIMYSDQPLRQYQYFVAPNWPGGIYASPSIAGSRPGGLIAACWAALVKTGRDGYIDATTAIVGAAKTIAEGIKSIDHLELCGKPDAMVVAFFSPTLNIYSVSDEMAKKGWNLNALQYPPAVHICCTYPTVTAVSRFLNDLKESVDNVSRFPNANKEGMGAIYGMAASIPDKSLVSDIAKGYLNALTKV